jgi:hypothetical protein
MLDNLVVRVVQVVVVPEGHIHHRVRRQPATMGRLTPEVVAVLKVEQEVQE